jgi:hypothetical protein
LFAPRLRAQWDDGTPEATVASALQADSVHDWQRLLPLIIPQELTKWRDLQATRMEMVMPPGFLDSCATREIARYHQLELDSVLRVPSRDSLLRTRPDTLFARAHTWALRMTATASRARRDPTTILSKRIIGSVFANDSLGWVAIANHYDHAPMGDEARDWVTTIEVRRMSGRWRVALDGDLAAPGGEGGLFRLSGGCSQAR